MWFWKRQRPQLEVRTRGEAYPGRTAVDGSALPRAPLPVKGPREAGSTERTGSLQPRAWLRKTGQFDFDERRLARDLVIGAGTPSEVHFAYNYLRTQVLQRLEQNGWTTVAVTSPSKGAGNTLTTINLAISIARNYNYSVMLVELDLTNPSFHDVLGLEQRRGIVDHLLHDVPISEIMLNPGIDRLVVVPAGSPVTNSSELISSPKMARLVEQLKLRSMHQVILFDLPSVLSGDDAMAFSPLVDCALLVVEEGETGVSDVRRALNYLGSTEILGVVLNRSAHADRSGMTAASMNRQPSRKPESEEQRRRFRGAAEDVTTDAQLAASGHVVRKIATTSKTHREQDATHAKDPDKRSGKGGET